MAREKCVLAYSGGMDSTISVAWIQEQYDLDIVTLTVDLGAGPAIDGGRERPASAGAPDPLCRGARARLVRAALATSHWGPLGREGAFDAMGRGMVDRNWAKEHHGLWVEEQDAKAGASGADSGAAATPAE